MFKVALLVLWCAISTRSNLTDPNKFIVKFAMGKAREACAGERIARVLEDYVYGVLQKCKYNRDHPIRTLSFPALPPFAPVHHDNVFYPNTGQQFLYYPGGAITTLGGNNLGLQPNILTSFDGGLGHRVFKRDTEKQEKQIRTSSSNIIFQDLLASEVDLKIRISNITCVLVNGEVMDANGNLLLDRMAQITKQFGFQGKLERDVVKGIYECGKFANCMPPTQLRRSTIPFAIKRAVVFLKCNQANRYEACLRKDIRETIRRSFRNDARTAVNVQDITNRMVDIILSEDLDGFENLLM